MSVVAQIRASTSSIPKDQLYAEVRSHVDNYEIDGQPGPSKRKRRGLEEEIAHWEEEERAALAQVCLYIQSVRLMSIDRRNIIYASRTSS